MFPLDRIFLLQNLQKKEAWPSLGQPAFLQQVWHTLFYEEISSTFLIWNSFVSAVNTGKKTFTIFRVNYDNKMLK